MQITRVTQGALDRYRREVDEQAEKARSYFHSAVEEFNRRYPDATTEDTRVFVLDLMGSVLPNFTDLTATLSCDLFDELAEECGFVGERARLYETTDWQMVDHKVRYLAGFINDGDKERFKKEVSDLTHYYCKRAAFDNMVANCNGQRIKWARVPTGLETCAFCFMLASRGFAYKSEKSASGDHDYHDNCNCIAVPGFEGKDGNPRVKIDGYDPETMYQNWLSCAHTAGVKTWNREKPWTDAERRAVMREVETRDWHWLYTGETPQWDRLLGAHPNDEEKATASNLSSNGFRVLFRPTTSEGRRSDAFFVSNGSQVAWEFKEPNGNSRWTVNHQFKDASGQSHKLVIDISRLEKPSSGDYWDREKIEIEAQDQLERTFVVPKGKQKGEQWTFDEVILTSDDGYCRRYKRKGS